MDELWVTDAVCIPLRELHWRFSRGSGPGGQGVNTTDSRVELVWDVANSPSLPDHLRQRALARLAGSLREGVLIVVASEYRSQLRNREVALAKLAKLVRQAITPVPPQRRPTAPSAGAKAARREGKRRRSQTKKLRQRPTEE